MNLLHNLMSFCETEELGFKVYNNSSIIFQVVNSSLVRTSSVHTFVFDFAQSDKIRMYCYSNTILDNINGLIFANYFNQMTASFLSLMVKNNSFEVKALFNTSSFKDSNKSNMWRLIIMEVSDTLINIERFYFTDRLKLDAFQDIVLDDKNFELYLTNCWNSYIIQKNNSEIFEREYYENKIKDYSSKELNEELDKLLLDYNSNFPKLQILQKYLI